MVVTYDDTQKRKPDPAPFSLALERLGVVAADAVMIGDWPERDVVGAKALGMTTVFARYGDTFGTTPGHSGADAEIDDVYELLDFVERGGSPRA
jgi:putative hydrolase of the HAD superfamily